MDVFSSTAATLVRRGTPAVVAMQYEITDDAAIEFSRSFYEALADGMAVDAALAEARKGVALAIPNTLEWGTPVLYMRSPDGVLFKLGGRRSRRAPPTPTPVATSEPPAVVEPEVPMEMAVPPRVSAAKPMSPKAPADVQPVAREPVAAIVAQPLPAIAEPVAPSPTAAVQPPGPTIAPKLVATPSAFAGGRLAGASGLTVTPPLDALQVLARAAGRGFLGVLFTMMLAALMLIIVNNVSWAEIGNKLLGFIGGSWPIALLFAGVLAAAEYAIPALRAPSGRLYRAVGSAAQGALISAFVLPAVVDAFPFDESNRLRDLEDTTLLVLGAIGFVLADALVNWRPRRRTT
jgi:hypothetical protein